MRRFYAKPSIRRDVWEKVRSYCMQRGLSYSDCLLKLVEEAEKPPALSKELEELIDSAVKLASKHPYEPESKKIFTVWEKIIG